MKYRRIGHYVAKAHDPKRRLTDECHPSVYRTHVVTPGGALADWSEYEGDEDKDWLCSVVV